MQLTFSSFMMCARQPRDEESTVYHFLFSFLCRFYLFPFRNHWSKLLAVGFAAISKFINSLSDKKCNEMDCYFAHYRRHSKRTTPTNFSSVFWFTINWQFHLDISLDSALRARFEGSNIQTRAILSNNMIQLIYKSRCFRDLCTEQKTNKENINFISS